ncbi:leucine-rich melanocyte differentiation-associated protein-like [Physella acuta]|uniref:leucine-rich melanocyte differentiation-associated protein-like n=1 Tax=Physella acuta TaxID=109671 RepID=UPI0027DE656F|nr:leucine-rich melanocyte differentiation-associated protein-like [Physella acuta]
MEPEPAKCHRVSLAYLELSQPPDDVIALYGNTIVELDLSHNKISDLRFLQNLPRLQSLVVDHNHISSHVKIPLCPYLDTLWVNHNDIQNLGLFITTVAKSCPNLRILSMMNNQAAPSFFNGGTYQQYLDYRYFVISSLPKLEVLDYTNVQPEERSEAKRIYPVSIVQPKKSTRRKRHSRSS